MSRSQSATSQPTVAADSWQRLLETYRLHAVSVLSTHLPSASGCSVCHQHWPCQAACAAELVLEL